MTFDLNSTSPTLEVSPPTIETGDTKNFTSTNLNIPNSFEGPVQNFTVNPSPPQPTSGFSSGLQTEQKYNDWNHIVEVYLDNSGNFNGTKRYPINPAAIMNLKITDTLNDWVVDGDMIMMYLPEEAPPLKTNTAGNPSATVIKGAQENGSTLRQYEFRGDGFDLLRIMIRPVENSGKMTNEVVIQESDPKWVLSYLFSIYDVEDLSEIPGVVGPASSIIKCIRLRFHDVRYQILKTTNIEYSTANSPDATTGPEGLANGIVSLNGQIIPRALKTGNAILEIWNQALSNPDLNESLGSLEFFQLPGSMDWDNGQSDIFYTSPAEYSAADDIEYIFAHHVGPPLQSIADANDLCFMHTNRPSSPELLEPVCITPLTKFFSQALNGEGPGELQLEQFATTEHTEEKFDPGDFEKKTPIGGNGSNINLKTFKYGQIVSYSFMDMSANVNTNDFITTPVYSVDIGKRQFNIQFQNNDLLSVRKAIAEEYIKKVFNKGSNPEKLFLPVIHKTKKHLNVFPTFSLNGDNKIVRQKNSFHRLLYTGLFQNACICFKTFGLTLRESGTFISIDKTSGSRNTDFANKLFGQWFVVKVDHIFEAGSYLNIIYAVKLHRHKERKDEFEETL